MPPRIRADAFTELGKMLQEPPPGSGGTGAASGEESWSPKLNPLQEEAFNDETRNLLVWGEKGCRTADAIIYTKDGLKRLGDMKPEGAGAGFTPMKEAVWAFDGKRVVPAETAAFWVESDRQAYRCELANGAEITGSPRHPLWVCIQQPTGESEFRYASFEEMAKGRAEGVRYWTPFMRHSGLSDGELVHVIVEHKVMECSVCGKPASGRGLCRNHYQNLFHVKGGDYPLRSTKAIPLTEDLAYAIGALVGDGSLSRLGRIGFSNTDKECIARVRRGLAEIGCSMKNPYRQCDFTLYPAPAIRQLIKALGINHLSYFKRIPSQILSSPKRVITAFLRGLFDTDGTVEKNGLVSLCTTSEKLSRDVQDVMACLGILAVRRPKKTVSGRPTWTVSMMGRHAYEYGRQIGFAISRKQARICKPAFSQKCPSGWNHNFYGYPDPIRAVCRKAWDVSPVCKSRENCREFARLRSWKSIPSRQKVDDIKIIMGSGHLFVDFLVSENWLEIESLTPCEAELFDLNVPGHSSFLASGTINHNSGKTTVCCHKVMRHCYENRNALALVLTPVRSMSEDGGAWHKIITDIAPQWVDGLKIETKQSRDRQHNEILWVQNRYGEWSQIKGISAPHAEQLRDRFPGREPSMVFVDELTRCSSIEYFQAPSSQLGRRPGVEGVQQFLAACNPEGPTHWTYKLFFEDAFDEERGEWNPDFKQTFLPVSDNQGNLPPDYLKHLRDTYKSDPIESMRLIGGQWIDRASGEALFREIYNPTLHIQPLDANQRPDPNNRLQPLKGHPLIIGLDPGAVHNAFIFMQWLPIDDKMKWVVFDEIISNKKRISYEDFIPMIMRRVKFWREVAEADRNDIPQVWVSDSSAFNQYRAAQGSFDVLEIERIYESARTKYGLEPIKIRSAPKFNGSVIIRVRTLQKLLAQDELIVSSGCTGTQAMLLQLEAQKQKMGVPFDPDLAMTPRRSDHLHVFDALTYPIITAATNPTLLLPSRHGDQTLISVG